MTDVKEWNVPYSIGKLKVHSDKRGFLYEAIRFSTQKIVEGGQIYVYTMTPGARRGDHFHERKSEWFVCVAGVVRLFIKTKNGDCINEILDANMPRLVYVGPGTAHALVNEKNIDAVMIAYTSKEFDASDPDTIFEIAN